MYKIRNLELLSSLDWQLTGVALVDHVMSLGVILQRGLSCDWTFKTSSQRICCPSIDQLNTVSDVGLIISRMLYALTAWETLPVPSAGQSDRIDAFLMHAH